MILQVSQMALFDGRTIKSSYDCINAHSTFALLLLCFTLFTLYHVVLFCAVLCLISLYLALYFQRGKWSLQGFIIYCTRFYWSIWSVWQISIHVRISRFDPDSQRRDPYTCLTTHKNKDWAWTYFPYFNILIKTVL